AEPAAHPPRPAAEVIPRPVTPAPAGTPPPISVSAMPPPAEEPRAQSKSVPPPRASAPIVGKPADSFSGKGNLEQVIGMRWMVWAGASIMVLGIGFFLKYAFEHGWIGPLARVILGLLAGLAMLGTGEAARRKAYRFLSQGLTGGGMGALYLSIYAASSFYHLIDAATAFLFMGLVTATGISLAVLQDALPIAVLSTLGGIITPVLLSTGEDRAEALFTYLCVLNLGVLGAAFYRRWRALDLVAYTGTLLLYSAWFSSYYSPQRMGVALVGLVAFFLLFILIPVVPVIRGRASAAPEAALLPLAVGLATYLYGYRILQDAHRNGFAGMLLLMAASHLLLARMVKRKVPGEHRLIGAQLALSMTFLTLAIPARLGLQAVTVAWAVEGPMLLWLGYRYAEPIARAGGCVVLGFAFWRVLFVHQPLHRELFTPVFNRALATDLIVAMAFGVAAWICSGRRASAWSRSLPSILALLGGLLGVFVASVEIGSYGNLSGAALQQRVSYQILTWVLLECLWAIAGLLFLLGGLLMTDLPARVAGIGLLGLASIAAALSRVSEMDAPGALILNRLFLGGVFVAASLWAGARIHGALQPLQKQGAVHVPTFLAAAALVEGWWVSTLESYRYFAFSGGRMELSGEGQWRAQLAVTVTWALFAVALLAGGFLRRQASLRYAAFALLGLSGVKVVLVDMSQARQIYRVISLLGLGLVMVGVSYVYSRIVRSKAGHAA
ncbi:MAG: DUF2339 domain-containing protein, partial [Acidobacteria bacterium]|nr:DUF2339 domain-containing protein [Acidobacteriota bacterium]